MTVGTNALLEQRGARTALVATRGFADLLEIARQDRPQLYRLCAPKPAPLVGDEARIEAAERVGPEGVIEPLDEAELERIAAEARATGAESVAVCLLFSYLDPAHERRSPSACEQSCPASTSPPRTRCCPSSASTSAARPRSSTPTSPPCSAATSAGSARPPAAGGCPSRR